VHTFRQLVEVLHSPLEHMNAIRQSLLTHIGLL
jgi:hypothetical protein